MSKASRLMKLIHPFTRKGWGHWLRFALLLTAAGYAGHLLSSSTSLTQFRYWIYHRQLMMRDHSQLYPKRTALVLLNDDDYWGDSLQSRTPLKRGQLADLIDKLGEAGVNTVALDVDLRSPLPEKPDFEFADYKAEDAQLIAAVRLDPVQGNARSGAKSPSLRSPATRKAIPRGLWGQPGLRRPG